MDRKILQCRVCASNTTQRVYQCKRGDCPYKISTDNKWKPGDPFKEHKVTEPSKVKG